MPTLEYFRRTSQIGQSPIYLSAQASISNLFINRGTGLLHGGWGRLDLFPVLSFPWKGLPWLSATTTLGGRFTGYTDSTDPAQTTFLGSSFTRTYMVAGVSLIGPSFSKIYEADIGPFGKFKHIIEPRVDYSYVSNVDDPGRSRSTTTSTPRSAATRSPTRWSIGCSRSPRTPRPVPPPRSRPSQSPRATPSSGRRRSSAAAVRHVALHQRGSGPGPAAVYAGNVHLLRRPALLRHAQRAAALQHGCDRPQLEDELLQCHLVLEPSRAGCGSRDQHRPAALRRGLRHLAALPHRHARSTGTSPRARSWRTGRF